MTAYPRHSSSASSISEQSNEALNGLCAWVGALIARAEAAVPLVSSTGSDPLSQDARSFGALWSYGRAHTLRMRDCPEHIARLLDRLYGITKSNDLAEDIWNHVIAAAWFPLPSTIASDLLKRGLCRGSLAHSWQREDVWWQLVNEYPEAVHNIACARYTDPSFDEHRLDEVFHQFPWWAEIGSILACEDPSHQNKALWLATQLKHHGIEAQTLAPRRWHESFARAWNEVSGS